MLVSSWGLFMRPCVSSSFSGDNYISRLPEIKEATLLKLKPNIWTPFDTANCTLRNFVAGIVPRGYTMHPREENRCCVKGCRFALSLHCVTSPRRPRSRAIRFANCSVCYIGYILLEISLQRGEDFRESQDLEPSVLQNDGRILFDLRNSNCLLYTSPSPRDA